eukprot:Polyplicarium_translucidae@DN2915_c1_g1_i6.p1
MWQAGLFPFGDREAGSHIALYLFGDRKTRRIAEFSMVVLDATGESFPDTILSEDATMFNSDNYSWGWHEFLSVESDDDLKRYIVDDIFRLRISVTVYGEIANFEYPRPLFNMAFDGESSPHLTPTTQAATTTSGSSTSPRKSKASARRMSLGAVEPTQLPPTLHNDVAQFATACEDSLDATITCAGETFRASRFILAARSEVFRAMLFGPFKESALGSINLQDVDPRLVPELLQFLSTDSCALFQKQPMTLKDVQDVLRLFAIADEFQIRGLHERSLQLLAKNMTAETVLDILEFAEAQRCRPLVDAGEYFLRNSRSTDLIAKELRKRKQQSFDLEPALVTP